MPAAKLNASIDLPALFDSEEPLFLMPTAADEVSGAATDESALSFDGDGDVPHETCTW